MTIEGKWSPWILLVPEYTVPLGMVARQSWAARADYIERLTGNKALGDRIGSTVYRKMYE